MPPSPLLRECIFDLLIVSWKPYLRLHSANCMSSNTFASRPWGVDEPTILVNIWVNTSSPVVCHIQRHSINSNTASNLGEGSSLSIVDVLDMTKFALCWKLIPRVCLHCNPSKLFYLVKWMLPWLLIIEETYCQIIRLLIVYFQQWQLCTDITNE